MQPENRDPFLRGIDKLAELSDFYGFKSTFYFISAQPSLFDIGYKINSNIMKRMIQQLLNNGHEIGFHAGYFTYDQPLEFIEEKKRIDQEIGDE